MGLRVLVVDDAAFMRMMIKDILSKNGFEVVGEGANGLQAVEKYKELKPDLTTMDITMPEMNGAELVTYLRGEDNEIPVFFITGYQDYSREVLNSFKPKAVIFKPFDIEEVSDLIKSHLLKAQRQ